MDDVSARSSSQPRSALRSHSSGMRAAAERSAVELQESHFELAQKYKAAARGERRLQHMVVQLQDELSQLRDALSAKVDDGSPVRPKSRVDEVVHDRIMELQRSRDDCIQRCRQLEKDVDRMRVKADRERAASEEQAMELERVQMELDAARSRCTHLEGQYTASMMSTAAQLSEATRQRLEHSAMMTRRHEEDLRELRASMTRQSTALAAVQVQLETARRDVQDRDTQLVDMRRVSEHAAAEAARQAHRHSEAMDRLSAELADTQARHRRTEGDLTAANAALHSRVSQLTAELETLRQQAVRPPVASSHSQTDEPLPVPVAAVVEPCTHTEDIARLDTTIQDLHKDLAAALALRHAAEDAMVRIEQQAQQQVQAVEREAEGRISELQATLAATAARAAELDAYATACRTDVAAEVARHGREMERVHATEATTARRHGEEMGAANQALEQLRADLEAARSEVTVLSKANAALEAKLTAAVATAAVAATSPASRRSASAVAEAEAEAVPLVADVDGSAAHTPRPAARAALEEQSTLEQDSAAAAAAVADAVAAAVNEAVADADAIIAEQRVELAQLHDAVQGRDADIQRLSEDLGHARARADSLERDRVHLEARVTSEEARARSEEARHAAELKSALSLQLQERQLAADRALFDATRAHEQELSLLRGKLEVSEQRVAALLQERQSLEGQVVSLRHRVAEATSRGSAYPHAAAAASAQAETVARLEAELAAAQRDIEEAEKETAKIEKAMIVERQRLQREHTADIDRLSDSKTAVASAALAHAKQQHDREMREAADREEELRSQLEELSRERDRLTVEMTQLRAAVKAEGGEGVAVSTAVPTLDDEALQAQLAEQVDLAVEAERERLEAAHNSALSALIVERERGTKTVVP